MKKTASTSGFSAQALAAARKAGGTTQLTGGGSTGSGGKKVATSSAPPSPAPARPPRPARPARTTTSAKSTRTTKTVRAGTKAGSATVKVVATASPGTTRRTRTRTKRSAAPAAAAQAAAAGTTPAAAATGGPAAGAAQSSAPATGTPTLPNVAGTTPQPGMLTRAWRYLFGAPVTPTPATSSATPAAAQPPTGTGTAGAAAPHPVTQELAPGTTEAIHGTGGIPLAEQRRRSIGWWIVAIVLLLGGALGLRWYINSLHQEDAPIEHVGGSDALSGSDQATSPDPTGDRTPTNSLPATGTSSSTRTLTTGRPGAQFPLPSKITGIEGSSNSNNRVSVTVINGSVDIHHASANAIGSGSNHVSIVNAPTVPTVAGGWPAHCHKLTVVDVDPQDWNKSSLPPVVHTLTVGEFVQVIPPPGWTTKTHHQANGPIDRRINGQPYPDTLDQLVATELGFYMLPGTTTCQLTIQFFTRN